MDGKGRIEAGKDRGQVGGGLEAFFLRFGEQVQNGLAARRKVALVEPYRTEAALAVHVEHRIARVRQNPQRGIISSQFVINRSRRKVSRAGLFQIARRSPPPARG